MEDNGVTSRAAFLRALLAAQAEARPLGKDGYNDHHRYSYVSAEAIIIEARECLHKHGFTLRQMGWSFHPSADPAVAGRLRVTYNLSHVDGESELWTTDVAVVPGKGRPEDKAEATALTFNLSYVLRGVLLLPRVEPGSEMDTRDDRDEAPRRAPAPASEPPKVSPDVRKKVVEAIEGCSDATQLAKVTEVVKEHGLAKDPDVRAAFAGRMRALSQQQAPVAP